MKEIYLLTLLLLMFSQSASSFVNNGTLAPDFELLDTDGKVISLSAFKDKLVVLEWTNHECPFVARHYETMNMQSTQDSAKKNNIVWLSIISSAPGTQGYVSAAEANQLTSSRNAYPSHVLFDTSGNVGRMYAAKTTPHMYIIDKKGILRYQGAIDDAGGRGFMNKDLSKAKNFVKEGIVELVTGKNISSPVTKPYGCSIKYAS